MKNCRVLILLLITIIVLMPIAVLAATYLAQIMVTESGDNSYTMTPVSCNISNSWMVSEGFMGSDARDTRVMAPSGEDLPHMVCDNWTLVVMDLPALSNVPLSYTMGNDAEDFDLITGLGGFVTITDNETIELGDNFIVEISGYFKTTVDMVSENITSKLDAFRLYIKDTGDIAASVNPGPVEVIAENIPSLYHDIIVSANTTHLTITVDGNPEDTAAFSANVTDNGDDWILGSDVMPYITYFKITQ